MSGFIAYSFTQAQLTDIRRFAGYPMYGDGSVDGGAPWLMTYYLALEYKLQHISQAEGAVVVATYLTPLYALETAIYGAGANMGTDQAAVWTRNKNEARDRERLFDNWRRRLCGFLGVPPGPALADVSGNVSLVV